MSQIVGRCATKRGGHDADLTTEQTVAPSSNQLWSIDFDMPPNSSRIAVFDALSPICKKLLITGNEDEKFSTVSSSEEVPIATGLIARGIASCWMVKCLTAEEVGGKIIEALCGLAENITIKAIDD